MRIQPQKQNFVFSSKISKSEYLCIKSRFLTFKKYQLTVDRSRLIRQIILSPAHKWTVKKFDTYATGHSSVLSNFGFFCPNLEFFSKRKENMNSLNFCDFFPSVTIIFIFWDHITVSGSTGVELFMVVIMASIMWWGGAVIRALHEILLSKRIKKLTHLNLIASSWLF